MIYLHGTLQYVVLMELISKMVTIMVLLNFQQLILINHLTLCF